MDVQSGPLNESVSLKTVRQAMESVARDFDPVVLSLAAAEDALRHATAVEAMAATVKALAARRVADGAAWKSRGAKSAADDLAQRTGTTVGKAIETLKTGERLGQSPEVDDAARRGELSAAQASAITDAVDA